MEIEIQQKSDPLILAWLGTPRISHAQHSLTFRTRKATALLAYLTVEPGNHAREKLAAFFWPESNTARGRGMLRTSLAHLREALDATLDTRITPYLNVEPQTLGFNFNSNFELDLHHIQAGLDAIQRQPALAERGLFISQLQTAVSLYRGDFLEGFSLVDAPAFEEWASLQREIWHSRMNLIFETLSQWQFEAGDLPAALETATRWRSHDLFGESAPQRLMQLHFVNGNRTAALEVYDEYGKMLVTEFGGKPSAAIKALAARIRARAPVRQPRQAAPLALAPADLSFVGRIEEFARLMAAYHAASHGQTQAIILVGEAGIGKTRLIAEFLHWATAQGADVLSSRAFETGGEVPYQPVAHLLRHRLDQEASLTDLLSSTWLAELSRLLPEVRDRFPGLPQPQPDEATAQSRLLEAITRLGEALAARAPLVLFIDDVQWADVPSLDALHYAMSKWTEHKAPILLLLCTRDSSATEKSNLSQWLNSLKAKLAVTQLALAPLTLEDTMTLVSSLEARETGVSHTKQEDGGQEVGETLSTGRSTGSSSASPKFNAFAQALFTETGGQPLYLVETIKALLEQKVLIPYRSEEGTPGLQWRTLAGESTGHFPLPRIIPNSVREAILDRLSRLTPAAVAMLTVAAVLGQAATFGQLAEISGTDQMAGLDALEELLSKRLLLDAGQSGQAYIIAHDKIRDVIYTESSAVRRQVLHSRAVTTMQGSGSPLGAARLAYHAMAAGMDAEAFHYSIAAGDAALHLFAASEAITHYETARKYLAASQLPPVELDKVRHLYVSLGRALELNSQFEQAGAVYEELQTLAQQRADPALKLVALVAQVTLRSWLSQSFDPIEGEALAQEALRLARQLSDSVAEAEILCRLVDYYRLSNRLPEAIRCGDQALALARDLNLREQTALTLNAMIKCYTFIGRLDLAEQAQREARELWRELNNLPMLARSVSDSAFLARWAGNYDRALTLSAEAYDISHSIAHVWEQSYCRITTGYIYWERGQPAQAIAVMEECIRLAEMTNYLMPQILTRADLGGIYASLGDSQRGFDTMQLALNLANTRLPTFRPYVTGLLARQYLLHNLLDEAAALIEQAKGESHPPFFSFVFQWIQLAEAELAFCQGDPARALAVAEPILQAVTRSGMRSVTTAVLYVKAQSLAALGEVELACAVLVQARTEAERLGSRRMLVKILTMQADLEGDPDQAAHLHRQAEEICLYISHHTPPELRTSFQNFLKA